MGMGSLVRPSAVGGAFHIETFREGLANHPSFILPLTFTDCGFSLISLFLNHCPQENENSILIICHTLYHV